MVEDGVGRVGAHRAVLRLQRRTGLAVGRADIDVLVERGSLVAVGEYEGWPLYGVDAVDAVPVEALGLVVADREKWLRDSVDGRTAARLAGVKENELADVAGRLGVRAGRFERYARAEVVALAAARGDEPGPVVATTLWARGMLGAGVAVVLDTETAKLGGSICEVAVVDAANGRVLLDSLVNPTESMCAEARRVHGIDDIDVAAALGWGEVLPDLLRVTKGRTVLAYGAEYDREVIKADCARLGLEPEHLGDKQNWACLAERHPGGRRPLGGPHRALGDCQAALTLLRTLADGRAIQMPLPDPVRRQGDPAPPPLD